MASNSAGSSKKHRKKSKSKSSDISEKISETSLVSERIENETSGETSNENGAAAEKGVNSEDELITKLYKEVIEDIMCLNNKKVEVSDLNKEMQRLIKRAGSKSKVKEDQKMNLSKPSNVCVYLSVHGTCHTGLVKKAIGAYFQYRKLTIFTNQLSVVSLGGGPGYDLVGFCSALQEAATTINRIKVKIVDTEFWKPVFKSIFRISKASYFGNLSKLHKNAKISKSFTAADFETDDVFKDESFSSSIKEADFILMVKLESFLTNYGDRNVIKNVVDTMKDGAKFIFIYKKDNDLFDDISSVFKIFEKYQEYQISYSPSKSEKFSTSSDGAHICVFQKK